MYEIHGMMQSDLIEKMCEIATRLFNEPATRGYVITAIIKLVAQTGKKPEKKSYLLFIVTC